MCQSRSIAPGGGVSWVARGSDGLGELDRGREGRCKVGWIVSKGGRESWDVWLEVSTGLVKLMPQTDA